MKDKETKQSDGQSSSMSWFISQRHGTAWSMSRAWKLVQACYKDGRDLPSAATVSILQGCTSTGRCPGSEVAAAPEVE